MFLFDNYNVPWNLNLSIVVFGGMWCCGNAKVKSTYLEIRVSILQLLLVTFKCKLESNCI